MPESGCIISAPSWAHVTDVAMAVDDFIWRKPVLHLNTSLSRLICQLP